MKKLSQILAEEEMPATVAPDAGLPSVEDTMAMIEQSIEMLDDLYNTLLDLEELSPEYVEIIKSIYNLADNLYVRVASSYSIDPVDQIELDAAELDGLAESALHESVPPLLSRLGFKAATPGSNTWQPQRGKALELYGIPMRAGKWADVYFAVTDNAEKPYIVVTADGTTSYAKMNDALLGVRKLANEGYAAVGEYISEVLSAKDDAGTWISDFVKSDAPQFKGKSKAERIKMALGAYYAAKERA